MAEHVARHLPRGKRRPLADALPPGDPRPAQVDLVIVEQHDWVDPGDASHDFKRRGRMLEELWVQLQSRGRGLHAPAFVVVSTAFTLNPGNGTGASAAAGSGNGTAAEDRLRHLEACVGRCGELGAVPPECEDFESDLFDRTLSAVGGHGAEDQHSGVLHWYGMAEVSMRNMLASAIRDGLWDQPECVLVGRFLADRIHPRPGLGHVFLADSLLMYLERAEEFWADSREATRYQARPTVPVNRGAWDVPFRTCFDHDHHGGIPVDQAATKGWALAGEGSGKPGWVATAAGAELTVRLDTAALALGRDPGAEPVTLTFTYLQSREGALQAPGTAGAARRG